MQLPFTLEEFLETFRSYNNGIGIAPLVLMVLAVGLIGLARSRYPWRHRAIAGGLALLWLWSGVVYHWAFFARINPAARFFAIVFVAQAVLLIVYGPIKDRLRFLPGRNGATTAGWALILYALVAYPLLGWAFGHGYPAGPSFGAPCPATIYFFGLMLWALPSLPFAVVLLPMFWAAVGTSAAMQLGIREDFGLAAAGVVVLFAMFRRRRTRPVHSTGVAV
jgi:hypothetical protein